MGRPPRGPVKVDKLGRPLNFGNYVNGRLVVTTGSKKGGGKGKGGSKGGRGGRGGGSGGGRGGSAGGKKATAQWQKTPPVDVMGPHVAPASACAGSVQ